MIARHIEISVHPGKFNDFKNLLDREVLPILQRQPGFLGSLSLVHENHKEHTVTVTLWRSKVDAENYNKKEYPKILEMVRPFLDGTPTIEYFNVDSTTLNVEREAAA